MNNTLTTQVVKESFALKKLKIMRVLFHAALLLFALPLTLYAQGSAILHGRVADDSGHAIAGASVLLTQAGSTASVSSQAADDGTFLFRNLQAGRRYTIKVSHVGYETGWINDYAVKANDNNSVLIRLNPVSSSLNEVVIVGYGTQRRKDVTGSVGSLKRSDYAAQPLTNIQNALQGRLSGVSVNTNSGAPGAPLKVRIRGANSINGGNDPLYVIDGITLTGIGLQDINPADIESLDVLKDAASTAIYGSRGANGVVVITTRKSSTNSTQVSYNGSVSFNTLAKQYDMLTGPEYAAQANYIAGTAIFKNAAEAPTTNWQNLIFRSSTAHQHNLSVASAGSNYNIYTSANYTSMPGIVTNTSYQKYGFRTNARITITPRLNLSTNLFISRSQALNNNDIGKSNMVSGALAWGPAETPYDDQGLYRRYSVSAIWANPLMLAKEQRNQAFNNSFFGTAALRYQFTPALSLSANFGIDAVNTKSAFINNDWLSPGNPAAGQSLLENYTFQNNEVLTYQKSINETNFLKLTAVAEVTQNTIQGFTARGSGLSTTTLGYNNLGLTSSKDVSSTYRRWGILSYVAQAEYNYNQRLLVNASFRADGSSKFKKKWGYFPSVGLGYNIISPAAQGLNSGTGISMFKLRGSWGLTGSQNIMPYSSLGILTGMQYSFGTPTLYQGYAPGNPPASLQWEKTRQADLGADIAIGNNITITADYYNKLTKDLLLQVPVPYYNGGGYVFKNIGRVRNSGVELSASAKIMQRSAFSWQSGFNISYNDNKVLSLGKDSLLYRPIIGGGIINTPIQVIKVGQPMSSFYLIPWQGIYNSQNAALGYKAGDNRYTDVNGNGNIGYDDRALAGNAMPKVFFGFNNSVSYKGLELNVFIQGSFGNKIFNGIYAANAAPTSEIKYPTLRDSYNYYTESNTGAQWANPASKTNRNYAESTQYLQNGSYARLKNISLAYTLPKALTRVASCKLSFSAQNVLTLTKYKGYDPEATSTAIGTDADAGIDFGAYPLPRTFTIGLNITF